MQQLLDETAFPENNKRLEIIKVITEVWEKMAR